MRLNLCNAGFVCEVTFNAQFFQYTLVTRSWPYIMFFPFQNSKPVDYHRSLLQMKSSMIPDKEIPRDYEPNIEKLKKLHSFKQI